MKELSLHILDIVQNSISANAKNINIEIIENAHKNLFLIKIEDDGIGMKDEMKEKVLNPFVTSRKTRKVGLGLSLFEATAKRCGGKLILNSTENVGTTVSVEMDYDNIDRPPLGAIEDTIISIIHGINKNTNIIYRHIFNDNEFIFDLNKIREIVDDINQIEIILWLKDYIKENIENIKYN